MDDTSIITEILDRPETTNLGKAIGALEKRNDEMREAKLSAAKMTGRYNDYYLDDEGGTDWYEALEVQRLVHQRNEEEKRAVQHARAMAIFVQRNRQLFNEDYI